MSKEKAKHIKLQDLEVYKLAIELSDKAWELYDSLSWQDKKIMGDQFIESTDSVGANIAEGYARYHYLDRIKFYYNARASLSESCDHWLMLLYKRKKIKKENHDISKQLSEKLLIKINNFIDLNYRLKKSQ